MKRILISRTDSIGDMILTLPMAGLLKKTYPESEICILGRSYTEPVVDRCSYVTRFLNWDQLIDERDPFTRCDIDIFIHVFPESRIASKAKSSDIMMRIGTSHRIYHLWTCNKLVNLGRKHSTLHESQLNVKLLSALKISTDYSLAELNDFIGWEKPTGNFNQYLPENGKFNLVLHMKSQGSAAEWSLENYLSVIEELKESCNIILTGTPAEEKIVKDLNPDILSHPAIINTFGKFTLEQLIGMIGQCDGIIACSTGPLHIASVSGIHTLGLYPEQKPMDAGRWGPIGPNSTTLSGKINAAGDLEISPSSVLSVVTTWIR